MDRRLGEPLPHQQANPPRARPWSEAEATFSNRPEELLGHSVLIRVSPGYPDTKGGLPTCYSPVRRFPLAEARFSLDLHVLSAPPAFVLSQDQTLREEWLPARKPTILSLRAVVLAQRPSPRHPRASPVGRFDDEVNTCSSPTPRFGAGSVQFSTYRRTCAVEFSKTGAASERTAQKKPPTRARRPPRVRIVALRVGPGGSYGRVTRVFQRRPCGRPRKYSDSAYPVKRAKRRLPTWSSAPASASRPTSTPAAGSPLTLTAPCWISRRASEFDATPSPSTRSAGKWTGSPSGSATSGTSAGASWRRTTRVKCSS